MPLATCTKRVISAVQLIFIQVRELNRPVFIDLRLPVPEFEFGAHGFDREDRLSGKGSDRDGQEDQV